MNRPINVSPGQPAGPVVATTETTGGRAPLLGDSYAERHVVQPDPAVGDSYVVAQQVVAPAAAERRVISRRRFDPAATLTVIAGIVLAVIGAVAMARAGLSGPLDEPVVQVAGTTHTAILGMIELGMGLILVWAGLSRDRGAMLFTAILFGAAALVAAIEPSVGGGALAIEGSWAVVLVIGFALLALVAAVAPTVWRSTDRIERV
jgi:hypothetical protein